MIKTFISFLEWIRIHLNVQGLIASCFVVAVCTMYIKGMNVPTELISIITLICGFYFGQRIAKKNDK